MVPRLLLLLCALGAALALSGCSADEETIHVIGTLPTADVEAFEQVSAAFTTETGVPVVYEAVREVGPQIVERRTENEGEMAADIALVNDPGMFAELVADGQLEPLAEPGDLVPVLDDVGLVDGVRYGTPIRVGLTSLVWYPPEEFAAAGYEPPETYQQLEALLGQMRQDGQTPWCLGIESAQSTGWVLTDWIEYLVLADAGPQAYDRWAQGELPFASPEVSGAAARFADLVLSDGNVLGGPLGIINATPEGAGTPMFDDPPSCMLHRQASFIAGAYPEEVQLDSDVDVFALPALDESAGRPLTGTVDLAALVAPSEDARAFLAFISSPETGMRWLEVAREGTYLSPLRSFDDANYPDGVSREQAEILATADVFRLDASLQMPETIGSTAFHTQMVDWIVGRTDLESAMRAIDERAGQSPRS